MNATSRRRSVTTPRATIELAELHPARSPAAGVIPAVMLLASILQDLENGEPLIPLRELSNAPFVPCKDGKKPHPSRPFRWAASGLRGVKLETINAPNLCTTRGAVLRFFARLSGSPTATASTVRRQRQRTDRALDAAGLA